MSIVREFLDLLEEAEGVFGLKGKLRSWAQQRRPDLLTEAPPDEGAAMDDAREAALRRADAWKGTDDS